MKEKQIILKTALVSRLVIVGLQYVSNFLIPDHKADAFIYPSPENASSLDQLIYHLLGGFIRWDAHHFMHISIYGYTYEHTLAFFPFYPLLVRYLAVATSYVITIVNVDTLTLLTFLIVNIFSFIGSALCLYDLSTFVLNKSLALKATLLFCFNPASIFFTAPYTESLFCYLSFKTMLNCVLLYKKYRGKYRNLQFRDVLIIIPICLSSLTRSNGILNTGFLLYTILCLYFDKLELKPAFILRTLRFMAVMAAVTAVSIIPFIAFQIFAYQMFCSDFPVQLQGSVLRHSEVRNFVLPGAFSLHNQSWCHSAVPLAYSYIQSHYWKVGFLQYFQLKQIPNFLLATPIIFICLKHSFIFFKQFPMDLRKFFNFNLLLQKSVCRNKTKCSPIIIVFVIHGTLLTLFCIFNIHIQVTTRMLCSASPLLYWFSAFYVNDLSKESLCRKMDFGQLFIIVYFLSYYVVGTILFCNFLPWT